ncbi:hypothetical protein P8452_04106 [Trifolium repens]|nr:hypothetical protein P8452_04106 [Trifolium repens]
MFSVGLNLSWFCMFLYLTTLIMTNGRWLLGQTGPKFGGSSSLYLFKLFPKAYLKRALTISLVSCQLSLVRKLLLLQSLQVC